MVNADTTDTYWIFLKTFRVFWIASRPTWVTCQYWLSGSKVQVSLENSTTHGLLRERTKHGPPVHGLPKWITQMDYPWKSFERRKTTVGSTPHNCSYHTLRVCFGNVPYMRSVSFAPYFGRHFEMAGMAKSWIPGLQPRKHDEWQANDKRSSHMATSGDGILIR